MLSSYGIFGSGSYSYGDLNFFINEENKFHWDILTAYFIVSIIINKKKNRDVYFPINIQCLAIGTNHISENIKPPARLLITNYLFCNFLIGFRREIKCGLLKKIMKK